MGLDMVVVLVLTVLYFGGIAFLVWQSHKQEQDKASGQAPPPDSVRQAPEQNQSPKRIEKPQNEKLR